MRSEAAHASNRKTYAGIDIGGTQLKVGLADAFGHLLSSQVLRTRDCRDASIFFELILGEIREQTGRAAATLAGVGVGCPGRIDFASGKVVWLKTKLEFLEGVPLAAKLSRMLGCAVVCDNDVNTILAGEMRFGAGRGYRNVVGLTVGTGIGGALVIGGHMIRGRHWATGHFGYMSHDPHGPRHVCGNTGVVEEHACHSGILRQLQRALDSGEKSSLVESLACGGEPGLRELFAAADAGDALGGRLANRFVCELGVLVANLIYALDPELILVGGALVNHRPGVLAAVRREAIARLEYLSPSATEILPMALGDTAGVLGGVALAMENNGTVIESEEEKA